MGQGTAAKSAKVGARPPTPAGLSGVGSSAAWAMLNLLLNNAGTFVSVAVGVRVLGDAEYGVFIVLSSLLLLAGLMQGGLALTTQYAAAKGLNGDGDARRRLQAGHSIYCYMSVTLIAFGLLLAAVLPALVSVPSESVTEARVTCVLLALAIATNWATIAFGGLVAALVRFDILCVAAAVGLSLRVIVLLTTIGSLGLVALGLSTLCGAAAGSAYLFLRVRGSVDWLRLRPGAVSWIDVRTLAAFTLPLFVLSGSTTLMSVSDVLLISALAGPAAVTLFRIGLQVPQMSQSLCHTAYGTMYPRMVSDEMKEGQERAVAVTSSWLCFAGAAGFTSLLIMRDDVLRILVGRADGVSSAIFAIYCGLFVFDLCYHPWVILILARARQGLLARLAPAELVVNVVLTAALVAVYGAVGSAFAAVCSTILANIVLYPVLARGIFSQNALLLVMRHGLVPALCGALPAGVTAIVLRHVTETEFARVTVALPLSLAFALLVGLCLARVEGREQLRNAFGGS